MAKMVIQFTMTAITCNLKRIVKLLFNRGCGDRSFCGKAHQRENCAYFSVRAG